MIENYLKAFKAYDIRGIYGKEIDKKFTYILGTAIGNYILEKFGGDSKFLIGCDVRNQNTEIIDNFVSGIKGTGFDNIFFAKFGNFDENKYPYGICSTSALYYLGQGSFDLGVSITASHNPGEYVGFKFFDKEVELIMTNELKDLFQKYYFDGEYFENILERHVELVDEVQSKKDSLFKFLLKKWEGIQKKYKFVVDFSTGAGTTIEHDFFEQIKDKHEINYINNFPDGLFSSHESDTTTKGNYEQLSQRVRERSADFGIMFDGDVDRIGFVTNSGEVVNCDIITAIIANQVLKVTKGNIIFDIMSSKVIEDVAKQNGAQGIRYITGRTFINKELNRTGGAFAGEASGHYMFSEIGGYEMPLLALYYVLLELENYENFDKMIQSYTKYYKTPIISHNVQDKDIILNKVKEHYKDLDQMYLDGVTVTGDNFWFNVRGSNTENKIKFAVESDDKNIINQISDELNNLIEG